MIPQSTASGILISHSMLTDSSISSFLASAECYSLSFEIEITQAIQCPTSQLEKSKSLSSLDKFLTYVPNELMVLATREEAWILSV